MVWRTVKSELLVEGGGIRHHLVWDDDYCFECNSRADYGKEPSAHRNRCTGNRRTETDGCSILNPQLCRLLRCPECGDSWTTNSGQATSNWESVIEHLLCKNDVANFIVAQDRAREVARAKAAGFSTGWIADVVHAAADATAAAAGAATSGAAAFVVARSHIEYDLRAGWDHDSDSDRTPTPPEMDTTATTADQTRW